MPFTDKSLKCRDCAGSFPFTAGEQEFYAARGLINEPRRCLSCRLLVRMQRSGKDSTAVTQVSCAECGTPTHVPFRPTGRAPVYCTNCYRSKKDQPAQGELLAV